MSQKKEKYFNSLFVQLFFSNTVPKFDNASVLKVAECGIAYLISDFFTLLH